MNRRGLTLIEILIATMMLAVVMIPIATFIIGGMRRTEISKHSTIAMSIASNIMDELLGSNVPFASIDPKGQAADGGVTGSGLPKSLPSVGNKRAQATFKSVTGGPGAGKLESIVNDRKRNDTRVKLSEEGLEFEIFFFAGVYADEGGKPDINKELTFSFLPNPYVPPDQVAATQKVLGMPASPALLKPFDELFPYTRKPSPRVSTPTSIKDWYPGWPQPTKGFNPSVTDLRDEIKTLFQEYQSNAQDQKFFANFQDQRDFGRSTGGLLKLILGVRWNPNTHVGKGIGYTKNTRELWLVSLKADLAQK